MYETPNYADRNIGPAFFQLNPEQLYIRSVFHTIQGEGPFAGMPAVFVRFGGCNRGSKKGFCEFCFPAHLKISTLDGRKRFDEVKVGDLLPTLENFRPSFTEVEKVISHLVEPSEILSIQFRDEKGGTVKKLVCTKDHPIYVKGRGFVPAKDILFGDVLIHIRGRAITKMMKILDNPMRDPRIAAKAGSRRKQKFASGEEVSYVRDAAWRKNQAKNMHENNPMRSNETVKKMLESKSYKQSKLETMFQSALESLGHDVSFVGNDPNYIIGNEKLGYYRPDFVVNGTTKLIEVYDTSYPFYAQDRHLPDGEAAYRQHRARHYRKFGYDVLFLTPQEIFGEAWHVGKGIVTSEKLKSVVGEFINNGYVVTSISKAKIPHKHLVNGMVSVINFSCSPHNTFCVENVYTHNCDTDFRIDKSIPYSPSDLVSRVAEKSDWGVPISAQIPGSRHTGLVVITGGEPMLQPALVPFCKSLIARNYIVQIESNGDFLVPGWEEIARDCHLVVSPKISTALREYRDLKKEVFEAANSLKFLVHADENSPYHCIPAYAHQWEQQHHAGQIFLSPMAIYRRQMRDIERDGIVTPELATIWNTDLMDQPRTSMNYRYAAKLALQFGWRVSIQQHLFLGVA